MNRYSHLPSPVSDVHPCFFFEPASDAAVHFTLRIQLIGLASGDVRSYELAYHCQAPTTLPFMPAPDGSVQIFILREFGHSLVVVLSLDSEDLVVYTDQFETDLPVSSFPRSLFDFLASEIYRRPFPFNQMIFWKITYPDRALTTNPQRLISFQ